MNVRVTASYRDRLNDGRHLHLNGEVVRDAAAEPAFAGAIAAVEAFHRLQKTAPETHLTHGPEGELIPISLSAPRTLEDLARKRIAFKEMADVSFGMLGRTPDFINSAIMAIGVHAEVLGPPAAADFAGNARAYLAACRQNDLFVAHASINPQLDRAQPLHGNANPFCGVRVDRKDARGLWVSGAKMIATLAPVADELLVFNMPGLRPGDEAFAVAFAVPAATEGLHIFGRKPTVRRDLTKADHPLANRMDEVDAYLVLKDVFVPWERVFVFEDTARSDAFYGRSYARHHTGHQGIVRGLAKAELLTGVAMRLAETLGLAGFPNIQEQLGELATYVETLRALILLSEHDATLSEAGVMTPSLPAMQAVRYNFPKMYERMAKVIQSLAAGSMLSTPHWRDLSGEAGDLLRATLSTPALDVETRLKLLNLAWDVSGDGFGQRQVVYEYYHAGDPMRIAAAYYQNYPKQPLGAAVDRALALEG
jgi:4-hydroxyphenylacetate 3-monooxygenase